MKLVMAAEYALRCVYYLCTKRNQTIPRKEIAEAMDIPEQFLVKIAHDLARAGIIEIYQGRKGGYKLTVDPVKLSVLDVVEAVTGKIILNVCLSDNITCSRKENCSLRKVWIEANDKLREVLDKAKFAELITENGPR